MDVAGASSSRLYPPGGSVLFGAGAPQLPAQDSTRRYTPVRVQAALPRGHPAPGQRPAVSSHLCHKPAEAARGPLR